MWFRILTVHPTPIAYIIDRSKAMVQVLYSDVIHTTSDVIVLLLLQFLLSYCVIQILLLYEKVAKRIVSPRLHVLLTEQVWWYKQVFSFW